MARKFQGALAYLGVEAPNPPNFVCFERAPIASDYKSFDVGTIWLRKNTEHLWVLTDKQAGVATWTSLSLTLDPTFDDVIINNTLTVDDVTINSSLTLDYINYASTLRTLADGSVYGLADGIDKDVYMGRTGDTSVWGQLESAGSTVAITKTATGINFEAAGGTSANSFLLGDANVIVPTAGGQVGIWGVHGIDTKQLSPNAMEIYLKLEINEQAGTAYELVLDDQLCEIRFTSASAVTLTVPSHAVIPYEIGTKIRLVQYGAGSVTVVGVGGVAVNAVGNKLTLYKQYSTALLIKQSNSSWLMTMCDDYFLDINTVASTSYTLLLTDINKEIQFTSGSAVTFTVPTQTNVNFPVGTEIILVQYGAGEVTVVGAGGVTINSCDGKLSLYEQYSAAALIKQSDASEGIWLLAGDIK